MRCYLTCLCSGSAIDGASNNTTLFNMIEGFEVAAPSPWEETGLPFECHGYLEREEHEPENLRFEVRFVWHRNNTTEPAGGPAAISMSSNQRMRVKLLGVMLPREPEYYHLFTEWRRFGEDGDWIRSAQGWPVQIRVREQQ